MLPNAAKGRLKLNTHPSLPPNSPPPGSMSHLPSVSDLTPQCHHEPRSFHYLPPPSPPTTRQVLMFPHFSMPCLPSPCPAPPLACPSCSFHLGAFMAHLPKAHHHLRLELSLTSVFRPPSPCHSDEERAMLPDYSWSESALPACLQASAHLLALTSWVLPTTISYKTPPVSHPRPSMTLWPDASSHSWAPSVTWKPSYAIWHVLLQGQRSLYTSHYTVLGDG